MFRKFCLALSFLAVFTATAHADWFSGPDLQKILGAPQVAVNGYELSRDELNTFYAARNFRPAWDFVGRENNETFSAFLASIEQLIEYHGLQSDDYPLALMRELTSAPDSDNKAKLELLVSDTLLRLAHDLHGDILDLADVYQGWNFRRSDIDIPTTLAAAIAANGLNEYIESLAPKNPAYRQLAQALHIYRAMAETGGWPTIEAGPALHPKDHGPRIAQLRARLAAEGYLPQISLPEPENGVFDEDLRKAVLAYQTRNGLGTDGNIGAKALEALNVPAATRIDQIMANMERWRHMPDDFPPDYYVLVNIPDVSVIIVEDGKIIYRGLVIVGRTDRKTPFIQSTIRSMIVNPIWHVPTKIARKDILPKLRKDPHYLEKLGFVIKDDTNDPYGDDIDWRSMRERDFNFQLRQAPGDQNSLGRLKFDFNNDFAVYMHGTPHQELFKKNERNLSSGCIRLQEPEQVAEIFLAHNKDHWDIKHIEDEINANKTHWVGLAKPIPIYVVYWSVFTDDEGRVNFRKDVYDYDKFLMDNLRPEPASPATQSTPTP